MYDFDIVVVGAGLSGMVAAARYLQRHPECNLTILEQDYCVGGVWSKRRDYPSFWTQWAHGIAEFSDFPMERPPEEDCLNDLFRAKYTGEYLEGYTDHVRAAGRSLRDRIQLNVLVQSVHKKDDRWYLACTGPDGKGNATTLTTARLMMATGQASIPRYPELPGRERFDGRIIHQIDYGQSGIVKDGQIEHVTVLGGGKSAADMVYESAKAGKTVSWVIRKTGDGSTGPGFFAPPDVNTPYQNPGYAAQTRIMSTLQPCFMNKDTWWTWFLHRTSCGVSMVRWIFEQADKGIRNRAAYMERDNTKGFDKLQYDDQLFWQNGVGGILHHADFYDVVAEKVNVYRARVKSLNKNELYLDDENGTHFQCDAILCGTGWQRGLHIYSDDLKMHLGLPYPRILQSTATEEARKWEKAIADADDIICNRFHILKSPPVHVHIEEDRTPYHLYRNIAPLTDDSIVFINHATFANKLLAAEVQAMWAVAYFDGNINVPREAKERDIAMWIAWCKRRYLSNGSLANSAAFDSVPYVDTLLKEMGVSAHLDKGWWRNWVGTLWPADLGRAWDEYLRKHVK